MDWMRLKALAARERASIRDAIDGYFRNVWTSLPAIIKEDSDGHTATAKSAIKQTVMAMDGTTSTEEMEPFQTAPVHFPGGGGVTSTHPVKEGDEGIALFNSMAQDFWWQKGGVQDPVDARRQAPSDVRWIPGGRSNPRKLDPAPSTSSGQDRSDDGNHVRDCHPQNGLTSASTVKHLTQVGGSSGSGTLHSPSSIIKNAPKVMINTVQQDPLPPPGMTIANRQQVATQPLSIGSIMDSLMGALGSGGGGGSGSDDDVVSQIADAMDDAMTNGIGTMLSSPIDDAVQALIAEIDDAVYELGGLPGSGQFVTALNGTGGLLSAVNNIASAAANMSGAVLPSGDDDSTFGLDDLITHAENVQNFFGGYAPDSVSMSSALGPLQCSGTLDADNDALSALVQNYEAGQTDVATAAASVAQMTSQLNAIVTASTTALTTMQNAAPALNLITSVGSLSVSQNPNVAALASALAPTSSMSMIVAAVEGIMTPTDAEVAAIASFPDKNTAQPGATGGM